MAVFFALHELELFDSFTDFFYSCFSYFFSVVFPVMTGVFVVGLLPCSLILLSI